MKKVNKEERNLTWKYFWQQKAKETIIAVIIIAMIVFIPYLLGHHIGDNQSEDYCGDNSYEVQECSTIQNWFEGLGYSIIIIIIVGLLLLWILENWWKAEKRAEEELKKRNKK